MLDLGKKLKPILNFNLRQTTKDAITFKPNPTIIEDMNKAQLLDGKDALGGDMPKYTQFSLRNKPTQFIPSNNSYSLKKSGKLHSLIEVTASLNSLKITSTDKDKVTKLQRGNDVPRGEPVSEDRAFGLTEPNRKILTEDIITPFMLRRLRGKV